MNIIIYQGDERYYLPSWWTLLFTKLMNIIIYQFDERYYLPSWWKIFTNCVRSCFRLTVIGQHSKSYSRMDRLHLWYILNISSLLSESTNSRISRSVYLKFSIMFNDYFDTNLNSQVKNVFDQHARECIRFHWKFSIVIILVIKWWDYDSEPLGKMQLWSTWLSHSGKLFIILKLFQRCIW